MRAGYSADRRSADELVVDADPSVRAAALGALARMGALSPSAVVNALGDPHEQVRRRACELAVDTPGVRSGALVAMLSDSSALVVEAAAWALGERGRTEEQASVGALSVVAREHREPLCREAAVAALGAIGHSRGLEAVVAALSDKAAVRRRAVVALAGFDGARAAEALRSCRDDRDWQVRDAASELVGE